MNIDIKNITQGQKQDCYSCEYSEVIASGEEYEGTVDCKGHYVNSDSRCHNGHYKNKFEDD